MRTLTLLAALLLLVFQARSQTLQETTEQVPAQDQPGDEDQDQPGDEDQDQLGVEDLNLLVDEIRDLIEAEDTVNSATGEERLTRAISGRLTKKFCRCQRFYCKILKIAVWSLGLPFKICGR
ncbi:alpha-defensin 24-like [Desmodus rotundus]|uniref:alpha-defensin 24-like n=1 Tax=Desmodus rotundus TaxID=9430 RepID=UPI0039E699F9